jgi:hypothetical protein
MSDAKQQEPLEMLALLAWDLGDPELEYPTAIISAEYGNATWIVEFDPDTYQIYDEWFVLISPAVLMDVFDMVSVSETDKSHCEVVTENDRQILEGLTNE